jgi:hypothetical protein
MRNLGLQSRIRHSHRRTPATNQFDALGSLYSLGAIPPPHIDRLHQAEFVISSFRQEVDVGEESEIRKKCFDEMTKLFSYLTSLFLFLSLSLSLSI